MGVGGVALRRVVSRFAVLGLAALISACATSYEPAGNGRSYGTTGYAPSNGPTLLDRPRVVATAKPLQCVPYARRESGIEIYGNAKEWWPRAAGKYRRSDKPAPGTVMVFRGSAENPHGHVAVVRELRDSRTLIIDHANWLGRGEVSIQTPVIDISSRNDWSHVRVWFIPGKQWGARTFKIAGFIHPERIVASR